jgi:hypothetical protein
MRDIPTTAIVLAGIPDPVTCKAMLSRAAREAELLRWLLKLANRKADLERRPSSAHAGAETGARKCR